MSFLTATKKPLFREALCFWWKLGWISFGGTAAHIALMHDDLVERKKWISNGAFLHALSHCMVLPGPEAQQLAIYIGWKLHGKKGGLAAGILFVLPSTFVLLVLSVIYVRFGNLPWIAAMFNGLKPAVIALILLALYRVAKRALLGPLQWAIAAVAFTSMFLFDAPLPLIMLSVVVFGVCLGSLRPALLCGSRETGLSEEEDGYFISDDLPKQEHAALLRPFIKLTAIALLLWLGPLLCFYFFAGDFQFWKTLALFFTKTAFVTVGGSYTVIPYVAQVTVTKLHWLSKLQMLDGFALAETTPGPLIIVVAFVGFMAGYNHFHSSLWMGTLGLLATTFYTFLPCFLFVFAGAPLVEQTRGKPAIKGVLVLITAVVVGAMLNLALFLGKGVVFPTGMVAMRNLDAISVVWVVASLLLLQRFKINVVFLILLSIVLGAFRYQLGLHKS
ncbi:MAG TPA: chromate efflux transporter [Bryobacteraceae bacterium]|nr:chromate efflux transporter [Bryobacteraceae bacterium]HTF67929.1 chromate efflux transporter [Edaphobacter sp.]